jgi:hypothetical protein
MVICADGYQDINGKCVPIPKGITVYPKKRTTTDFPEPNPKSIRWEDEQKTQKRNQFQRRRIARNVKPKSTKNPNIQPSDQSDEEYHVGVRARGSGKRFAISGHSREGWEEKKERGTEDLKVFLGCVRDEFPGLTLVAGDATGVDRTGAEIFENLGGDVVRVPHDTFRYPTSRVDKHKDINSGKWRPQWDKNLPDDNPLGRNEAMLRGGYETTDSTIVKLGNLGEWQVKGEKVQGRKAAPWGTSPKANFLGFWMFKHSRGTADTVNQAKSNKVPQCDIFHTGGKACCEQMRGIF